MPAASRIWPTPAWRRSPRTSAVDDGDRFDLDHRVGIGKTTDLDRRAGRGGRAEIAQPHVAVLGKFLVIGDVSVGLDDVREGGAGRFEAGLDVLPGLLDLGAHVALTDTIAVRGAGELPGDEDHFPGAADRDGVGIGRVAGPHHDMDAMRLNFLALDRHLVPFPYNTARMIRRAPARRHSERGPSCP